MIILDEQLGFNINRIAIIFRRELMRCLKEYKLSPEQWQVLVTLWNKKALSQAQIIELTLQDAPSTSKMISRMEKSQLIEINASNKDKRVKVITLTKKGNSYRNTLPSKLLKHFEKLLIDFPLNQRKILLIQLKQLRISLGDIKKEGAE